MRHDYERANEQAFDSYCAARRNRMHLEAAIQIAQTHYRALTGREHEPAPPRWAVALATRTFRANQQANGERMALRLAIEQAETASRPRPVPVSPFQPAGILD